MNSSEIDSLQNQQKLIRNVKSHKIKHNPKKDILDSSYQNKTIGSVIFRFYLKAII